MDEEEQQQSDSKISVSSFFERVDSVEKVANSALSKSSGNFSIINNQKTLINSINVSIEALETKVRDIANYIIIEKKLEKDAEEDRLFEKQDEEQKGSMLERLAGLKSNNESEQTQAAGEEQKKGGGGILGTLLTLGVGAFAIKFLWPAILPAVGGLLKGALAKFALFAIGGIGKLINAMIVGSGLTGIALGIGPLFERFGQGTEDTFVDAGESASKFVNEFELNENGEVSGGDGTLGGGDGGTGSGFPSGEGKTLAEIKEEEKKKKEEERKQKIEAIKKNIGFVKDKVGGFFEGSPVGKFYSGAYENMKKTLQKKNLIEEEGVDDTEITQDLTIEQLERKITVSENKIASLKKKGANEELIEFENDKIEQLKEAIRRKESGVEVTATRTYKIENEIENGNLDLSLSETFSDKLQPLNDQIDTLSEDFTGSINSEGGQMFSRPSNSPNTTVTIFKQTSSNSPFTSLMSNKYLSLNSVLPPEVYRSIK